MTRTTKDDWSEYEWPKQSARNAATKKFWDEYDYESHPCAGCGKTHLPLEVHHIDGNPYNEADENLEARCEWCHRLAHRRMAAERRVAEMREEAESLGDG